MKSAILVILAISLLVLSACSGGTSGNSNKKYVGGTNGVALSFEPNSPPAETVDGGDNSFAIAVRLENKGETAIKKSDVFVKLAGFPPQNFNLRAGDLIKSPPDDLSALQLQSSGSIIPSSPSIVEFQNLNHVSLVTGASQAYPIQASACYAYTTNAGVDLCSRKDLLNSKTGGVCNIKEGKTVANSGAPVQVVNVQEYSRTKDKIAFSFEVSHAGSGNVYDAGSKCNSQNGKSEKVKVKVDTNIAGLTCSGMTGVSATGTAISGTIAFIPNSKNTPTITCVQQLPRVDDYRFPAVFELSYDYEQVISTNILVKSSQK